MTAPHPTVDGVTFKDIPGYPGYCAGDDGSIWSNRARGHANCRSRWHRLAVYRRAFGYLTTSVTDANGKRITRTVHGLVLEAFVGPRPPGYEACHDPDPDPANNRPSNLRWDTLLANRQDTKRGGRSTRGSRNPRAVLTEADIPVIREKVSRGVSRLDVAAELGVSRTVIDFVIQGKTWKHVEIAR